MNTPSSKQRPHRAASAVCVLGGDIPHCAARALCYVPLYDMLAEIVHAIKADPEAGAEMRALARRGRRVLDNAKKTVPTS